VTDFREIKVEKKTLNLYNKDMKNFSLVLLVVLVFLFGGCAGKIVQKETKNAVAPVESTSTANQLNYQAAQMDTSVTNIESSSTLALGEKIGEINVTDEEFVSTSTGELKGEFILYAEKEGKTDFIKKITLNSKKIKTIYQTKELVDSDTESGNIWQAKPAGVALSPDKSRVAITDERGLYILNLSSGKIDWLITAKAAPKAKSSKDYISPVVWSRSELKNSFLLEEPKWSADGKYLSFIAGYYEGSLAFFYNIDSGSITETGLWSVFPSWSPKQNIYSAGGDGGYSKWGLFVTSPASKTEPPDIANVFDFNKEYVYSQTEFFSDGKRIAYIAESSTDNDGNHVIFGSCDLRGGNQVTLDDFNATIDDFIAGSNSNNVISLITYQYQQYLVEYDISSGQVEKKYISFSNFNTGVALAWSGNLLWLTSRDSYGSRIIAIDLTGARLVYASPVLANNSLFLGLINN